MTWDEIVDWIRQIFRRASYYDNEISPEIVMEPIMQKTNREKLYDTAKICLGEDLSTDPAVPPEVSCAVAVNNVYKKTFGVEAGGGASTAAMYEVLKIDTRFSEVSAPLPGDIWICPSGTSLKGAPHGHVGIGGFYGILSNNSLNGLWEEYYTDASWKAYYETKLGFTTHYFRVV